MRRPIALAAAPVLALAAVVLATAACSSKSPPPPSSPAPAATASALAPSPATSAARPATGPALPTLDALAARSAALAPGMREVARGDLPGDAAAGTRVLVQADDADTCARVAFAAQPAVHASLVNARGDVLADAPASTDTQLAARGPVCVRKGDAIAIKVDGASSYAARFVAWASP